MSGEQFISPEKNAQSMILERTSNSSCLAHIFVTIEFFYFAAY